MKLAQRQTVTEFFADKTLVFSPLSLALRDGVNPVETLRNDVQAGETLLQKYVDQARAQASEGNIVYVLEGARGAYTTPMEYGGHFLELDREILSSLEGRNRFLYAIGADDLYIDFVSDLPAEVFVWDSHLSGFDTAYVKSMRDGDLATNEANAEIELVGQLPALEAL